MHTEIQTKLDPACEEAIWQILCSCDKEFIPPLSDRSTTTQTDMRKSPMKEDKPYTYFKEMKNQHFILAVDENRICGFMSFQSGFRNPPDSELVGENNIYITTICVAKNQRRKGIANMFYERLENEYLNSSFSTRTWSSNIGHISLLHKRGYLLAKVIPNDRDEGIDTVYYAKPYEENT